MNAKEFLKKSTIVIDPTIYAIVKAKKPKLDAFAVIIDKKEITLVIDQSHMDENNVIEISKDWKLITFDMVLPFELTGFLAVVSQTLADVKVSIFALSSYSTDHILVKQKDLDKAIGQLTKLGCTLQR